MLMDLGNLFRIEVSAPAVKDTFTNSSISSPPKISEDLLYFWFMLLS